MANYNVLSERYATDSINEIFSEEGKILAERELWIAVMKSQKELGMDIPSVDIENYEAAKRDIDLAAIKEIEQRTRHDVKAKIEAFVKVSGSGEHIHKGMTSRDLTDNVEQMQNRKALEVIFGKNVSVLRHFSDKAGKYQDIILTARTHHQAAQPTLLGRRFAMWGEEHLYHLKNLETFVSRYPLRGMKGPIGTQVDMLTLLKDENKVDILEMRVAEFLGFNKVLTATGQVYPRSLDYALTSQLSLIASAPESFAKTMRLMAGYELVTEGFKDGQVGSSAMPHKMNTRSSERICGLSNILKMHNDGASRISGDQWEEGDVSCSVPRRIILPDVFYASDGLCETTLTVLNEMGAYPTMISKEVDRYLPFLATTEILMHAISKGMGREQAHKTIKKYAVAEALRMKSEGSENNYLAQRLAEDLLFKQREITRESIEGILQERSHFIGNARRQIDIVGARIYEVCQDNKKWADYEPKDIL